MERVPGRWHHTVGRNRGVNLNPDGVLGFSPDLFYLEVLLQPLEKQLDLPSVLVEFCNSFRADIQCICEED